MEGEVEGATCHSNGDSWSMCVALEGNISKQPFSANLKQSMINQVKDHILRLPANEDKEHFTIRVFIYPSY